MTHNAEFLDIFDDPAVSGQYFEVTRLQTGQLESPHTHALAAPYPQAALALASAMGLAHRRAGLRVAHEQLARDIMGREGYYYLASHQGLPGGSADIAAYAFTEDAPDGAPKPMYMVNELEAMDVGLGLTRNRVAVSGLLHCMLRGRPAQAEVLFPTRRQGEETRGYDYLERLGVSNLPHANWGERGGVASGRVGTILGNLTLHYGMPSAEEYPYHQ
jgi:hypothetical protein